MICLDGPNDQELHHLPREIPHGHYHINESVNTYQSKQAWCRTQMRHRATMFYITQCAKTEYKQYP